MSTSIFKRLTSVPLSRRYYQVTNGVINYLFGGRLGITHLVEYPRCGGTWVRHLVQDALDIPQYAYDRILTRGSIIQCHALPNAGIRRAIVLFRDPRDTLVSFYHKKVHYDKKFRNGQPFQAGSYRFDAERSLADDFAEFLRFQLETPDHPRFSYGEFARLWLKEPNTIVARYEDFLEDAIGQLRRLVSFLGAEPDESRLASSVEKNSFANRTLKRSGQSRTPGAADSSQFERKGIAGDWKNTFNEKAKEIFLRNEGETLILLGYETDNSWANHE